MSVIYIRDIIVLIATKLCTMNPRMTLCNRDVYFFDHFLLFFSLVDHGNGRKLKINEFIIVL